jgi:hypothetical protein
MDELAETLAGFAAIVRGRGLGNDTGGFESVQGLISYEF